MATSANLRVGSARSSWVAPPSHVIRPSSWIHLVTWRSSALSHRLGLVVVRVVLRRRVPAAWSGMSLRLETIILWPFVSFYIGLLSRLDRSSVLLRPESLNCVLILWWHSINCRTIGLGLDSVWLVSALSVLSRLLEFMVLKLTRQNFFISSGALHVNWSVSIDVRLLRHDHG